MWVPPMRTDEMAALHHSHPFYRHSDAAFFIAEDHGQTTGRIGVMNHRPSNSFRSADIAFFGFFESIDDQATSDALFAAAASWASDQGLTSLVGPKGLLPSDGHGVLVDGFDITPALEVGYHHRYYDRLIQGSGLTPATDYVSGQLSVSHEVPDQVLAMADSAAADGGYELKTFDSKRDLKPWILRFGRMYNETMSGNWEYTPVDDVEIEAMADRLLPIADPRLMVLLMQGDDIVGYLLLLPDVSETIRQIGGRLLPFGWAHLLRAVKRTRKVNILAMGLVPEHRGAGANLVLYAAMARGAHNYDIDTAEVVQVEEGNVAMMRNLESLRVPWTKRHRMYRRDL